MPDQRLVDNEVQDEIDGLLSFVELNQLVIEPKWLKLALEALHLYILVDRNMDTKDVGVAMKVEMTRQRARDLTKALFTNIRDIRKTGGRANARS